MASDIDIPIINPGRWDAAMDGAIMFYSAHIYGVFDHLSDAQRREAVAACTQWSMEEPLWMRQANGAFAVREIPHFGKRSSIYAMALMTAYLVWEQKHLLGHDLPHTKLLDAAVMGYALWRP